MPDLWNIKPERRRQAARNLYGPTARALSLTTGLHMTVQYCAYPGRIMTATVSAERVCEALHTEPESEES